MTADEIADPHSLNLWLEVDGKRYQDGNTSTMIFRIPQIVSYLSRFMSLQPGDVISLARRRASAWGRNRSPSICGRARRCVWASKGWANSASKPYRPNRERRHDHHYRTAG